MERGKGVITDKKKEVFTNNAHICKNRIDSTPMNISQAMKDSSSQPRIITRPRHELMTKDTPQMNHPRRTHSQPLQDEIRDVEIR